jgi:uncharacterized membrane protein YccC
MERLLRHIRNLFRLQPGRPAISAGIRAALAVTVPFTVATAFGMPQAGWTGLTGLLVTLADRGGSYQGRARVMGWVTLLGALVGGLAAPLGNQFAIDAPLVLIGVFAASFVRCFGETEGGIGEKVAVIFVASLGSRALGFEPAAERFAALLIGGVWAMIQSLLLWPLHPYGPSRRAVAQVYSGLGDAADELSHLSRTAAPQSRWTEGMIRHWTLRRKIDDAREALAAARVGRSDQPRRSEHLLVLLELSERMVAMLFALGNAMEATLEREELQRVREEVSHYAGRYASNARCISVVARDPTKRWLGEPLCPPRRDQQPFLAEALPASTSDLLGRLRHDELAAQEAVTAMQFRQPVPGELPRAHLPGDTGQRSWTEPVRSNFRWDSVVLRHALRAGLVACAALTVAQLLHLRDAYWVVLAAIGILQPYSVSTEERALQRVGGMLLGGTLAAAIGAAVGSPLGLIALIGVLTAISVSLLPLNFGAFQILLTPDFLLLATLSAGDWTVAENRALGVFIACALALAGAWLLWPLPERCRFPDAAASVLRADGNYFRTVAASSSGTEPEVGAARRDFGLAVLEAEASFDRLAAEYRGPAHRLEPAMALLTYARRLAASITALREQRPEVHAPGALEKIAVEASGRLETLASSLNEGVPPPPLPTIDAPPTSDDPVSAVLVERVPRQLDILSRAVEKVSGLR